MIAPRLTLTPAKPWQRTSLDLTSNPLHGAKRVFLVQAPINFSDDLLSDRLQHGSPNVQPAELGSGPV